MGHHARAGSLHAVYYSIDGAFLGLSGFECCLEAHAWVMATLLADTAGFERELTVERIRSGIGDAKAHGKKLSRQHGQRPKSDRLAPKVLALVVQGCSYRLIGREMGLSKNTVADIVERDRRGPP